ncbi:MAG TPA: hypothetical protein VGR03_04910 [Candidatus Acidoferrum sp.]|nr:hypothetical protein [Candidatus Acidoferrum sp.]
MNCEEFAELGFDFERARVSDAERTAAQGHLRICGVCAAQMESWRELRERLQDVARETQSAQATERVELQLRRKVMLLGYEHRLKRRRTAFAATALAAAAIAVVAFGIRRWGWATTRVATAPAAVSGESGKVVAKQNTGALATPGSEDAANATQEASLTQDEFLRLPGSLPLPEDEGTIVRMRMQRGALGALGLPVNEEQASEWIVVDLLVSADGQPQAVRLSR